MLTQQTTQTNYLVSIFKEKILFLVMGLNQGFCFFFFGSLPILWFQEYGEFSQNFSIFLSPYLPKKHWSNYIINICPKFLYAKLNY